MIKQMKWMIAAILLCGTVQSVQAQSDDIKHEIGVSYGGGPLSTWARIGTAIADAIFEPLGGAKYENTSFFGPLSGEYFYHLDPSVGVGAIVCFSQDNDDILIKGQKAGDRTTKFYTFMPAVKWDYLRREHFGMYLKAGAGYSWERVNETYNGMDETSSSGMFNFQVSLLGLEAGNQNLRGFFELGFGEQGVVLAGARYKF